MTLGISGVRRPATKPYGAAEGYDLVAEHYDRWSWQEFWRRNEYPLVLSRLLEAAPTRGILDVGVGTGAFLSYAAPHFSAELRLTGVDVSGGMLKQAQSRLGTRVELLRADIAQKIPLADESFDSVVMMRVANHIQKLDQAIMTIRRVLSIGGFFIATDLEQIPVNFTHSQRA
jgi:ubiquinone/menaquinone biosynthesis C-methylase UbiE